MSGIEVNVDFSNTGEEIIVVQHDDVNGKAQTFAVRPQQIVRRPLPIMQSFYFTFTRGRFSKNATHNFSSNKTIDLNVYFV